VGVGDVSFRMTQTIGQRLKTEREEQRLTLEKVFEATRIRVPYLQALEADDLSLLPSPVQARGYLRNYAEFLGLDFDFILKEMQAMNAQQASGKVIGPADEENAPAPLKNNGLTEGQQSIPIWELSQEKPTSIEEPESILQDDLASQASSLSSITVPLKPKPARRKKRDDASELKPASIETSPKRRGRKKIQPEEAPALELKPEPVEESVVPIDPSIQTGQVEEPRPPVETISEPNPISEGVVETLPEETTQIDVGDTLWQTWLNRLGSVLSARARRRTLIPKEMPTVEGKPLSTPMEAEPVKEEQNLPQENSLEILKNIGRDLRERRELLSLHFDEVERNTHVKAHYLDALERGALDDLPSTVQTRGMLANYATFLDLDVDALLLRFADALQARHRERNPQKPARQPGQPITANIPPVRGFIAGDMIFGVSMVVLLVGFAIWGVSRVMTLQSQREVKPTAPSISEVLLASPDASLFTATPTFLPVESIPGEATVTVEIPTQNVNAQVQLNLVAVERTYMRVIVDGKTEFDGRVLPGNAYPFEAENQIEVLVGSGAAIRVVYNGRDLGLMGTFGQVVNNIYLDAEILTPTALPTATGTVAPTPTNTALPTATPRLTATPALSATATP
jgi:cytoskeleton protein RodZ